MSKKRIKKPKSLTNLVYQEIKNRIKKREYLPGDRLVENKLANEFNFSKTPIREALSQLIKEGLLSSEVGKGVSVKRINLLDIINILEIRECLEGYVARKATINITNKQLQKLDNIIQLSEDAICKGDLDMYKYYDNQFHSIIHELAGNNVVVDILKSLEDKFRLVISSTVSLPDRAKESLNEHKKILVAFKERNEDKAEKYTRYHVKDVKNTVIKNWNILIGQL